MASKEDGEENLEKYGYSGGTEEETIALQKKRSRRVSFAETTSIHVFVREEDDETPPGNEKLEDSIRKESQEIGELLQSQSSDESESDDNDNDEEVVVKASFLRPMGSPSPGSNFGSATSNDEDNFFGPVSTEFIKPRRLSDSAASDENHDITMDSTAFSMHFRSLARSDSGGDFKTPTGVRIAFDGRTPGQMSSATSSGDQMVLTAARKPISCSSPLDKVTDSGHSDDMSLVNENLHKYDYGKLPPELDVLLDEECKDMGGVSTTGNVECSNPSSSLREDAKSALDQNRYRVFNSKCTQDADVYVQNSTEVGSAADANIDRRNASVAATIVGEGNHNNSYNINSDLAAVTSSGDIVEASQINNMPSDKAKASRKDAVEANGKFESPLSISWLNLDNERPTNPSIGGSLSSLLAKRRPIFKVSADLLNEHSSLIPLAKDSRDKESVKHISSASYFTKSDSRLKRLEAFPFSSTSKAVRNASRLISPGYLSRSNAEDNFSEHRSKDFSINHVDAPVARLEAHFSNVAEKDGGFKGLSKVDNNCLRTTEDAEFSNNMEEVVKEVELRSLSKLSPVHDNSSKVTCAMVTPSSTPQKRVLEHSLSNSNNAKRVLHTKGSNSLVEIGNDMVYNNRAGLYGESGFPPENGVERKVSSSPLVERTLSSNNDHQSLRGVDYEVTRKANNLACQNENTASLLSERNAEANISSSDIEQSKDVAQESQMQNEEAIIKSQYRNPATTACLQNTVMFRPSESCASDSFNGDGQSGRTSAGSQASSVQMIETIAASTAKSDTPNYLPKQVLESPLRKLSCSLVSEKQSDANEHLFHEEDVSSWLLGEHDKDDALLERPFQVCDSDIASGSKRKHGVQFNKTGMSGEIALLQHNSRCREHSSEYAEGSQVSQKVGDETTIRHWADVFTSFCGAVQLLLSPWTDKLDLALIENLNDVLVHLEREKNYELLHHDICFKKASDYAGFFQNKRMVETKLLFYRTAYEKAKLQLLHLKRDKLLDQVQLLNSGVQETEMLMPSCQLHGQHVTQVDCFQLNSRHSDVVDRSSVLDDISLLRKELEASDEKINNLTKSFHSYFKVVEHQTCSQTTDFLKDSLKKRVCCRSLQSELQLCEVEGLKTVNGQQTFLFDHLGFMSQRFVVNSIPNSGVSICNKLNHSKISKRFFGMDACIAFSFVLSSDAVFTYSGLRTVAQVTQKTNLLLHNLLDVVEEVELAMIELRNLTKSKFCQPSDGELDLQFYFCDVNSGAKVTLSTDVSCLNRGVYPSEVLPDEVQVRVVGNLDASQLLSSNIRKATQGLKCGYMRILYLCRCVSKTIQASGDMR